MRTCNDTNGQFIHETQLPEHQHRARDRADRACGKQNSLHCSLLRADQNREIENGRHKEKPAEINVLPDVAPHGVLELAKQPRRKQQQRQRLLRLVVQQHPARERGKRPQQDRSRPVFLNVEDLATSAIAAPVETVPTACSVVERPGNPAHTGRREVEDRHHRHHQRERPTGPSSSQCAETKSTTPHASRSAPSISATIPCQRRP